MLVTTFRVCKKDQWLPNKSKSVKCILPERGCLSQCNVRILAASEVRSNSCSQGGENSACACGGREVSRKLCRAWIVQCVAVKWKRKRPRGRPAAGSGPGPGDPIYHLRCWINEVRPAPQIPFSKPLETE
ncbi:unnamed protein product [Hermetia illucens]|uniref:Uncharacterized protein n=1 Tax=Hermetia illucens TaxID=343691 RepID=A0A7R8UQF5_HERIL|nr:unnamed protein product [Hermetia illucens]